MSETGLDVPIPTQYSCAWCGQLFNKQMGWKYHVDNNTCNRAPCCVWCRQVFDSPAAQTHHVENNVCGKSPFCGYCRKIFKSHEDAGSHIENNLCGLIPQDNESDFIQVNAIANVGVVSMIDNTSARDETLTLPQSILPANQAQNTSLHSQHNNGTEERIVPSETFRLSAQNEISASKKSFNSADALKYHVKNNVCRSSANPAENRVERALSHRVAVEKKLAAERDTSEQNNDEASRNCENTVLDSRLFDEMVVKKRKIKRIVDEEEEDGFSDDSSDSEERHYVTKKSSYPAVLGAPSAVAQLVSNSVIRPQVVPTQLLNSNSSSSTVVQQPIMSSSLKDSQNDEKRALLLPCSLETVDQKISRISQLIAVQQSRLKQLSERIERIERI